MANLRRRVHRRELWMQLARRCSYRAPELARSCEMNLRRLQRHFQEDFGRSPQEWLNEQRMIAARYLILEDRSVKAISLELGFKQTSHFCREFKRCYGFTPTGFADRMQKNLTP